MFPELTRDVYEFRNTRYLSLLHSSQLSVSLSLVRSSLGLSHSHTRTRSFPLTVPSSTTVSNTEEARNTARSHVAHGTRRDQRAPPSLSRSRSHVCSSPATMLDTRRHGPHGARGRTHARTHDYLHAARGRDAASVRTTTSTSPPYAFVAAIFFGDTVVAIRESRSVKRTRVPWV